MDACGITVAILHDVLEDTEVSKDQLTAQFGSEVAELVDGVTKISKLEHKSHAEAQAENVRKMLLAMANDLRVIIVKLADRLHNMQTITAMSLSSRRRIARETLDIYVPLANRLSMNDIRHQLEDLCFAAIYPQRYQTLLDAVGKSRGNRRDIVSSIEKAIQNRLDQTNLVFKVRGREKNVASIYDKMRRQSITFADVFDVFAFRIYCDTVDDCYRILGCVHNLYNPVPGKFKDYIALPKANGYQSLHTVLAGPFSAPLEIQIRTHDMHRLAEFGIAAHWQYKSGDFTGKRIQTRTNKWLTELLEIQKTVGDSLEFLENLKVDLFAQEVFVFTPQGNIIKLPIGASIVDFAYAVHTDIGNSCAYAKADNRSVPLQTKLENGVTVEVITADWGKPSPLWLNCAITAKARSAIRNYLKNFKQKDAIKLGGRLLEKELAAFGIVFGQIKPSHLQQFLQMLKLSSKDELLEAIGLGNKMPALVANQLAQTDISAAIKLTETTSSPTPLIIKGGDGMVIAFAKCCYPIPDDHIVGFFNPGKGIVIHRSECRNSYTGKKTQASWLDAEWSASVTGEFCVEMKMEVINRLGTLATIAATISAMDSNIENVIVDQEGGEVSINKFTIAVKNRLHLANIIRRLKTLDIILKITRVIA